MLSLNETAQEAARELARRARQLRLELGWSQTEAARRAGIAFSTLRHFERSGQISLERLLLLARALDAFKAFDRLFEPPKARTLADLEQPRRQRGRRAP
jgi:transcriptional regulator with XRE-family HTH domain